MSHGRSFKLNINITGTLTIPKEEVDEVVKLLSTIATKVTRGESLTAGEATFQKSFMVTTPAGAPDVDATLARVIRAAYRKQAREDSRDCDLKGVQVSLGVIPKVPKERNHVEQNDE